uniref:Secreted protein n=1 Tax=Romanomermis culicivorax TaxID=13658 RepID=A0A915KSS7_ROMCU
MKRCGCVLSVLFQFSFFATAYKTSRCVACQLLFEAVVPEAVFILNTSANFFSEIAAYCVSFVVCQNACENFFRSKLKSFEEFTDSSECLINLKNREKYSWSNYKRFQECGKFLENEEKNFRFKFYAGQYHHTLHHNL